MFDLKIKVGHSDLHFMISVILPSCFISWEQFDFLTFYLENMS